MPEVQAAVAVFNEDLADYRQTVLTAFQQVEDQLAALRIFADEATVQDAAVVAAREAVRVLNNQYLAGTVAYTSVIVAEQTALGDAETALTIREDRLVASASLIQALGGGWNASQLPSRGQIEEAARSTSTRCRRSCRCRAKAADRSEALPPDTAGRARSDQPAGFAIR